MELDTYVHWSYVIIATSIFVTVLAFCTYSILQRRISLLSAPNPQGQSLTATIRTCGFLTLCGILFAQGSSGLFVVLNLFLASHPDVDHNVKRLMLSAGAQMISYAWPADIGSLISKVYALAAIVISSVTLRPSLVVRQLAILRAVCVGFMSILVLLSVVSHVAAVMAYSPGVFDLWYPDMAVTPPSLAVYDELSSSVFPRLSFLSILIDTLTLGLLLRSYHLGRASLRATSFSSSPTRTANQVLAERVCQLASVSLCIDVILTITSALTFETGILEFTASYEVRLFHNVMSFAAYTFNEIVFLSLSTGALSSAHAHSIPNPLKESIAIS
jgi:hypothetical protein